MQGTKLTIDKSVVQELASQYSDTLAAKELGIAVSSFYSLRKKYGIVSFTELTGNRRARKSGVLLPPGEGTAHPQHADLNKNAFEVIDTEEKAYFLGLMAADGHTSWKLKAKFISIELQNPDSEVLLQMAKLLNYKKGIENLCRKGKKPSGRLLIYSKELTASLISKGITETTETHSAPSDIPKQLRPHFLRGLIDGDGHIKVSTKSLNFTTCSKSLIDAISDWCEEEFKIQTSVSVRILKSKKPFYCLTFGGRPRVILDWLYSNSTVSIARKKEQALAWLSLVK